MATSKQKSTDLGVEQPFPVCLQLGIFPVGDVTPSGSIYLLHAFLVGSITIHTPSL